MLELIQENSVIIGTIIGIITLFITINKEFLELMENINRNLYVKLEKATNEIKAYLTKIVNKSIPNNLKEYANGYVITLMQFFAGNKLIESLIENNFLNGNLNSIQISYFIDKE